MTTTSGVAGQSPQTYDFTKRKRWADLLLTELVDNIALVLSVGGKVLYCGKAVTELLGWRDVDLVDVDFVNLVDMMDQPRFLSVFNESLNTGVEFNALLHLRHKETTSASYGGPPEPKYVLFDLKCYPHVDGAFHTRCFFGMAAPYPSRNIAMLNTILDLKAENIRLQYMIAEQRARLPRGDSQSSNKKKQQSSSSSESSSIYATSCMSVQGPFITSGVEPTTGAYFPSSSSGTNIRDFSQLAGSESASEELSPEEEGAKKKKLKRTHNQLEQYVCVTCGRTESPEWRKGPGGPKTLCNACGLRWAKQLRKADEPT